MITLAHMRACTHTQSLAMHLTLPLVSSPRSPHVLWSHVSLAQSGPPSPGRLPLLSAMGEASLPASQVTGSGCIMLWKLNLWDRITVSLNVGEVKAQGLCLSQLSMASVCLNQVHLCGVEVAPALWEMLPLTCLCQCVGLWTPGCCWLLPVSQPVFYWDRACFYELGPILSAFALGCISLQRFPVNPAGPEAPHSFCI